MNKFIHGVILVVFGTACWFVSAILRLPLMATPDRPLPAFSRLGLEAGPWLLFGMAVLALAYCIRVWTRKPEAQSSWVAFLATAVAALGLAILPTIVAIYLPLVDTLNQMASR